MSKLLWLTVCMVVLLSGCGWSGTPNRSGVDFFPLTSIEIIADSSAIAAGTSAKLTVKGNYSGIILNKDITEKVTWSSDTPDVARFESAANPNRVKGVAAGSAILTATVGRISATYRITVSSASIDTIKVTPETPTVAKGLSQQFKATGTFSDLTTQDITFDVFWKSSATDIATVSNVENSKGLAVAVAASGTSTITATFGSKIGTAVMTDTAPELNSIALSKTTLALYTGATQKLTVTATYSDDTTKDVTADAEWTSSSPAVATVVNSLSADKGLVTAVAAGSATISASYGGKTVPVPTSVTVTARVVQSLSISPNVSSVTVSVGKQVSFVVTATFTNGTPQVVTDNSEWTSGDPTKATVNRGIVSGVAIGPAIITVKYGGQSLTVTVNVT